MKYPTVFPLFLVLLTFGSGASNFKPRMCFQSYCPDLYFPVCGTDGLTYMNYCYLMAARCFRPEIDLASFGRCYSETICPEECPMEDDPVCGSDDVTYRNDCLLKIASCANPSVRLAHLGSCGDPCSLKCPIISRPVCGSDGNTYQNDCFLRMASCEYPTLTVQRRGVCSNPHSILQAPVSTRLLEADPVKEAPLGTELSEVKAVPLNSKSKVSLGSGLSETQAVPFISSLLGADALNVLPGVQLFWKLSQ